MKTHVQDDDDDDDGGGGGGGGDGRVDDNKRVEMVTEAKLNI